MKFSSLLLSKYSNIPVSIEQLANDLTLKTCEVEEIFERKIPDLVLIGKVLEVWKHPNADTLFITKIDCGNKGVFQICTGGENVTKNSFVPVAIPGCYLPSLDVTIGERNMRGEESNGMICSKKELGFNEDEQYHWIRTLQVSKNPEDYAGLPDAWKVVQGEFSGLTDEDCGKPLKEKFSWMEGFVLDVDNKTLTHRADLFGHFGLAQEISGIYHKLQTTNHKPQTTNYKPQTSSISSNIPDTGYGIPVTISTSLCSFYGAISGTIIESESSSSRLQKKEKKFIGRVMLGDLGLQARHDWVNFGNLYMYMTGQPVHVFDADKISGSITVRQAKDGESFLDLTGKEHSLSSDDVVIADESKVLALAGIIGGSDSGVSETTKKVIIEVAHFDPVQVRKTGMRLGIRTDAQQRYEKYINPAWTKYCFETMREEWELDTVLESIQLTYKHSGFQALISHGLEVTYNLARCSRLIYGDETSLDEQDFRKVLMGLGFIFSGNVVTVPLWRSPGDITIEDDLVEEYIRIKGYETVPSRSVTTNIETIELSPEVKKQRFLEQYLLRKNFSQVETYPWNSEKQIVDLGMSPQDCYLIKNPIDTNLPYLRPNMLWSMLGAVVKNAQTFPSMKLFDTGKIWKSSKEYTALGLVIAGSAEEWKEHPFVVLKGILEGIISKGKDMIFLGANTNPPPRMLGVSLPSQGGKDNLSGSEGYSGGNRLYHPLQQADLSIDGTRVGTIATLHPLLLESQGIKEGVVVAYAELLIDDLDFGGGTGGYETNEQQLIRKEAGFLFDTDARYDGLMQTIIGIEGVLDIKIVDLYVGDRIPADKKNVTISFKVDGTEKEGDYANAVLWKVVEVVKKVGGEMRV